MDALANAELITNILIRVCMLGVLFFLVDAILEENK
jgi:hypothetical protein